MMKLDVFVERDKFLEKHSTPKVVKLSENTKVTNKGNTGNRHPDGFDGSWMKYWMGFSGVDKDFACSVDGNHIWIEGDDKSFKICKEENRLFELMYYPQVEKAEEAFNKREAHGAHVEYKGKIYIVPMCAHHNTSLKDKDEVVTLKAGTILVEEVDPKIDKK